MVRGFDSPRIVALPDGRTLWMLQDAFVDRAYVEGAAERRMADIRYVNNVLLVQDRAGCFSLVSRGDQGHVEAFEPGTQPRDTWKQFWWAASASATSGQLQILWVEMTHDPTEDDDPTLRRNPLDGPAIHPVATWLGVYDLGTFGRLSFSPAPEPGVMPIVGFDSVDDPDTGYTFLFGNTFLQNLALEPLPPFGAHSATTTWLARVPIGRLDLPAEHWTGDGWSRDPGAAQPIAQEGRIERIMHPQLIGGVWWSVTKPDGFLGSEVVVETAPSPQGPWTVWGTAPAVARDPKPAELLTYAPVLTPWLDADGNPLVVLSQIDPRWWVNDGGDPTRYRPQALTVTRSDG